MIHHSAIGGIYYPVHALIRYYIQMRDNNAKEDDIMSSFWDHLGLAHLTNEDKRITIRRAVITLRLSKNGILSERVGSHSLRSGGAMTLKLSGADRDDIKKMGRWRSDAFLIYIHD